MTKSRHLFVQLLLLLFIVFSPLENGYAAEDQPLSIYAVNYPLKFFAEQISMDTTVVTLPMPADIDPAFWSPSTEDIIQLQQADIILLNGANYAKWLPKVSLPIFKLVNTSSEFRNAYISLAESITHQHGSGGQHSHTGTAFTTWLDFAQAGLQAKAIYKALIKKRPELQTQWVQNFIALQASLAELDDAMKAVGKQLKDIPLIASHPVYQYLQRAYQLNLKSVHWEPEEFPTDEQWQGLQNLLQDHPAQWMIWEDQPAADIVAKLETFGIQSIVFSPCANAPESGDFLSNMHDNVDRLKTVVNHRPVQ